MSKNVTLSACMNNRDLKEVQFSRIYLFFCILTVVRFEAFFATQCAPVDTGVVVRGKLPAQVRALLRQGSGQGIQPGCFSTSKGKQCM